MAGAIFEYFAADHARLDALAKRAGDPAGFDREAFDAFREGLLRHIGLEEKLLFPAVRKATVGEAQRDLKRFRVEHAAITSLLVGTPDAALLLEIQSILTPHNQAEEQGGGLYEACDAALGSDAESVLARARAYRAPKLRPYQDHPRVLRSARDALRLATTGERPGTVDEPR